MPVIIKLKLKKSHEVFVCSFTVVPFIIFLDVSLMIYFKVVHPPAAANPLIALFADTSINYIVFPVVTGSTAIIILAVIINKHILKRKYPLKWLAKPGDY